MSPYEQEARAAMMRRRHFPVWVPAIALVLLLGVGNTAVAQKWGKVTDEEWNLTPPPQMPEADAIVLFDKGQCEITLDGIVFDQHVRIKIFNKQGAEEAATININYYDDDKVRYLKAHTITPDGKKKKVKEIFDKKADFVLTKSFAFPAVEDGVIVEYQYRLVHRRYSYLDPWFFQGDLFTLRSEFDLLLYPGFTYNFVGKNLDDIERKPVEEEIYQGREKVTKFSWTLQDLYPTEDEPLSGLENDYHKSLYYQLVSFRTAHTNLEFAESWEQIGGRLTSYVLDYADGGNAVRNLARSLCTGRESPDEKIACLYTYVRDTYDTRDGQHYGYANFIHDNVSQLLDTKYGRASEKNLLLMSLLRNVGIEAYPLIIGTRDYSSFSQNVHQLWQFNHLVCYIPSDNEGYALDTGDKSVPFPYLPLCDLVDGGLLLDGDNSGPVFLSHRDRDSRGELTAILVVREDGSAACSTRVHLSGHSMAPYHELRNEPAKRELIKSRILRDRDIEFDVVDASVACDPAADTMCFSFQLEFPALGESIGDNLFIAPGVFMPSESRFRSERRCCPVDFRYRGNFKYKIMVVLPPGMTLAGYPEDVSQRTQGLSYSQLVLPQSDRVEIRATLAITQPMIRPTRYPELKEIFDAVVQSGSEKIAITHGTNE